MSDKKHSTPYSLLSHGLQLGMSYLSEKNKKDKQMPAEQPIKTDPVKPEQNHAMTKPEEKNPKSKISLQETLSTLGTAASLVGSVASGQTTRRIAYGAITGAASAAADEIPGIGTAGRLLGLTPQAPAEINKKSRIKKALYSFALLATGILIGHYVI